jgi:3-hydroxyisobutyrate dehydrogenase-like beta-hydroxyacid dehydrogenase
MIVDLSTTGPKASIEIASAVAPLGIEWVEAPISGGPKGAENGTLAVMLCCSAPAREKATALLSHMGKVFYAGAKPGLAQTAKLANNMLSTTALVATSEVMAMAAKAGLDPRVLLEIINAGSGRNSATVDKFPRAVVTRGFNYGFATGLAYKDMRLCLDEAENLGVPMIVGAVVRQMMAATNARYGSQSDFTEVMRIYEDWTGVTVGGPEAGTSPQP